MTVSRRRVLGGLGGLVSVPVVSVSARAATWPATLDALAQSARAAGIRASTLSTVLPQVQFLPEVIRLDQHQAEFTQSWTEYSARHITPERTLAGKMAARAHGDALRRATSLYGVPPEVLLGIWGLETNFGATMGTFHVLSATATLAAEGRRAAFFATESVAALKILDAGDVSFDRMMGSYSGAMGQPQFMPSSFLRLAVDGDNDGRRDIWDDTMDVVCSMGNFLKRSGWRADGPIVQQVTAPAGLPTDRTHRPDTSWADAGVTRFDGQPIQSMGSAYLVRPDADTAFLAYPNFDVIRRYNASDFYALGVAIVGSRITST